MVTERGPWLLKFLQLPPRAFLPRTSTNYISQEYLKLSTSLLVDVVLDYVVDVVVDYVGDVVVDVLVDAFVKVVVDDVVDVVGNF